MLKTTPVLVAFMLSVVCCIGNVSAQSQRTSPESKSAETKNVNDGSFLTEPVPKWVLSSPTGVTGQAANASMHYELLDEQNKVDSHGVVAYSHLVRVIDLADGLSAASEFHVDFNPAYETLVFHKIEIWRNGVRIDKLNRRKVKMLHREPNLERQVYDGVVTASLVIDDARVGDRVDIAYSIRGTNPVFDGKYVHTAWMTSIKGPVKVARFRLLIPEDRVVQHRVGGDVAIKETLHDGLRDTEFLRVSVPQLHGDQFTPASAFLAEQISLSEYADWKAVVQWGENLFTSALTTPSDLVKKTAQSLATKAVNSSPEEKVRLALDFVQNDIRYFGTEIGENSLRPTSPDVVIRQRFGDCKDKSLLLIALLKEMGIKAEPVFVSTQYRNNIDPAFPSPLSFNHAIARVEVGGKIFWLDGTRSGQTGTLAQRQSVGLGKGLVLSDGIAGLADLPGTDNEERIVVEENYRFKSLSEAPVLELQTNYFGELAEMLRAAKTGQPIDVLASKLNADFARFRPNTHATSPLRMEDVPGQNAVRIVQTFTVPKFWRFPEESKLTGDYMLWNLIDPLRHVEETSRPQPFQIAYPGIYRHTVTLEFPEDVTKNSSDKQIHEEDAHLYFQVEWDITPRKYMVKSELRTLKDMVSVAEWPAYTNLLRKIQENLGGTFYVSPISFSQAERIKSDARNLTESWQGLFARNRPVTEVQKNSMITKLILTAELEGGRLTPDLKAQVLHKRGIQFDNLGLYDLAKVDFEEALKIEPSDGSILADAAINSFNVGQYERARDYVNKALELDPSSQSPLMTLAYTNYFERNYQEASRNLLVLLKNRSEVNHGYAAIWLYLAAKRNNEEAATVVKPFLASNQSAWPHPLLQYLMGDKTIDQVLDAARADQKDPSRLCELYFYLGEESLINGKTDQAKEFFRKSIDTGVVEFNEYLMSKRNLQSLEKL